MAEDTGTNTHGKGFSSRASSNFREEHARLVEAMEAAAAAGKFKDGDLVVLKSGGPVMTVDSQGRDDEIVGCRWFRMDGKLESEFFPSECLRHAVKGDQVA